MARIKSKAQIKHRKIRKLAKGYHAARSRRFKSANEAVMHAGQYAYTGRKLKRRDLRSLWITRLSAAAKMHGLSYSKMIKDFKDKKIELDRKILSHLAATKPEIFEKIIGEIK